MKRKIRKTANAKQQTAMEVEQIKSLLRGMMITSPIPWKIQEKTGDVIDANGRFVARVGWGIEKFKHPIDQNNRDLIIKAVQFYMEQKELEAKKAKLSEEASPVVESPIEAEIVTPVEEKQ